MTISNKITPQGYKNLEKMKNNLLLQLEKLNKDLIQFRSFGDLRENEAFHSAKDQKNIISQQLSKINEQLKNSQIIKKVKSQKNFIDFGSKVTLKKNNSNIRIYTIVGENESDFKKGLIPITSLLATKLLNKKKGDIITINRIPKKIDNEGNIIQNVFEIVSIE